MSAPSPEAIAALETAASAKRHSPDWLARGGLLLLGSYCLYGAVDHSFGDEAAVLFGALGSLLGLW